VKAVKAADADRSSRRIEALRGVAARCVDRGQFPQAEASLLRALAMLGAHRGHPSAEHLAVWNELGIVYKYLGQFQKARKLYRSALFYCDSTLNGNARWELLANLYHNLGGLEHSQRRFRRAEAFTRKSIRYRLRVRPKNAASLAADRIALAAILDGQGKFEESKRLYRDSLRASKWEIALVLNNLGAVYQKTGRIRRAEKAYRASLGMKIMTLGREHPDVAVTLNNLGMLLAVEGRNGEADGHLNRAWRLLSKRLGPNHPNTLAVRKNLDRLRRTR
jgi:tetratricopeptide (TPR) repeat protein